MPLQPLDPRRIQFTPLEKTKVIITSKAGPGQTLVSARPQRRAASELLLVFLRVVVSSSLEPSSEYH
jgi:hypothetical protein